MLTPQGSQRARVHGQSRRTPAAKRTGPDSDGHSASATKGQNHKMFMLVASLGAIGFLLLMVSISLQPDVGVDSGRPVIDLSLQEKEQLREDAMQIVDEIQLVLPPPTSVAPKWEDLPPSAIFAHQSPKLTAQDCKWRMVRGKFMGEFVESSQYQYTLDAAKDRCFELGDLCKGVTCVSLSQQYGCTLRKGTPFLAHSPSKEVSYTKHCGNSTVPEPEPEEEEAAEEAVVQEQPASPARAKFLAPRRSRREPLQKGQLVVVVIAHNRPEPLQRCLQSLTEQKEVDMVSLAVSLDDPGAFPQMEAVVNQFSKVVKIEAWRKPHDSGDPLPSVRGEAVSKISEHFRFALTQAFDRKHFEYAVFLENDLLVAPDFFHYFRSTAWLLEEDPSLFCVSAWNDNGFKGVALDERRLYRTDYFPGLGWMMRNDTWDRLREIWPRWPSTGWDHWLRHGSGLVYNGEARECIFPEVPRTHHFDTSGTNVHAGSALAAMLERMVLSTLGVGQLGDLSRMLHDAYEEGLKELAGMAQMQSFKKLINLDPKKIYLVPYLREDYKDLARSIGICPSQPRTAHRGVIITRHPDSLAVMILADRRKSFNVLPDSQLDKPHPNIIVDKAQPGQSCSQFCTGIGGRCHDKMLEFVNTCAKLRTYFPCESGCGHQVGQEIPCYVHDTSRDTAQQCLVTDDVMSVCTASHPSTTRLCACVP